MLPKTVLLAAMSLDLGGAETHVLSLAVELKRRGYNVLVSSQGGRLVGELERADIPHFFLPLHTRAPWQLLLAVHRLRAMLARHDVQLIHAHARIPAWVSELARRPGTIPLVTTYHGVYSASFPFRLFTRWGDLVIAVSDDVRDHLVRRFGLNPTRVTVIPNGIDLDRFTPEADISDILAEHGLKAKTPRVLHLSRLHGPFADTSLCLIEAVPLLDRKLPQVEVIIAGDGDRLAEVRQAAERVNRRLGRQACLVIGGREDTPPLYALADVVVGVARVALEAMAVQRPVIIAGEGGYRGVLTADLMASLAEANFTARGSDRPVTPGALAQDIETVLAYPERARELAVAGRQLVARSYSIRRMVDSIESVYERAMTE